MWEIIWLIIWGFGPYTVYLYEYNRLVNNALWDFITNNLELRDGEYQNSWGWFYIRCPNLYPDNPNVQAENKFARKLCDLNFAVKLPLRVPRPPLITEPPEFAAKDGKVYLQDYRTVDDIIVAVQKGTMDRDKFNRIATWNRIKWLSRKWFLRFFISKISLPT